MVPGMSEVVGVGGVLKLMLNRKIWCIYTMEYYSAIKRDGIGSFVEMWLYQESGIQSEVSQKEKNKQ